MSINQFEENGDTYFQLFASCPVCHNQGRNAPRLFWTHGDNNCHGDIYVGDNAYYKCRKCGLISHVRKLMLSCPRCSNATDEIRELKAGSSDFLCRDQFYRQNGAVVRLPVAPEIYY